MKTLKRFFIFPTKHDELLSRVSLSNEIQPYILTSPVYKLDKVFGLNYVISKNDSQIVGITFNLISLKKSKAVSKIDLHLESLNLYLLYNFLTFKINDALQLLIKVIPEEYKGEKVLCENYEKVIIKLSNSTNGSFIKNEILFNNFDNEYMLVEAICSYLSNGSNSYKIKSYLRSLIIEKLDYYGYETTYNDDIEENEEAQHPPTAIAKIAINSFIKSLYIENYTPVPAPITLLKSYNLSSKSPNLYKVLD